MSNIAISAESTIDLTPEILKKYSISTVPFSIVMGERVSLDGQTDSEAVFAYTKKTGLLAKTSAVNEAQFSEHFGKLLKTHDSVIHFSLSSGISSAFNNAILAAKSHEGKVIVIDTGSLSTGIALLAIYGAELAEKGVPAAEIAENCRKRIPSVQASFALESVDYLYKGGRCSALSSLGANLFHIRPQIIVKEGKMISGKKFRGPMDKWVPEYIKTTLKEFPSPDKTRAFVTYSSAPYEVVEEAVSLMKKAGFKEVLVTKAGGTIACYCGPRCLGVLFINDKNS